MSDKTRMKNGAWMRKVIQPLIVLLKNIIVVTSANIFFPKSDFVRFIGVNIELLHFITSPVCLRLKV